MDSECFFFVVVVAVVAPFAIEFKCILGLIIIADHFFSFSFSLSSRLQCGVRSIEENCENICVFFLPLLNCGCHCAASDGVGVVVFSTLNLC